MNAWIVLVGSGALIVLATLAGLADARARGNAWRSIAARRRANWEEGRRYAALSEDLMEEAGACPCPGCRMIRRAFGQGDAPEDRM